MWVCAKCRALARCLVRLSVLHLIWRCQMFWVTIGPTNREKRPVHYTMGKINFVACVYLLYHRVSLCYIAYRWCKWTWILYLLVQMKDVFLCLQSSNCDVNPSKLANGNLNTGTLSSPGCVSVPQRIHSITSQYISHTSYLVQAMDLWDQGDAASGECAGEFTGALTGDF